MHTKRSNKVTTYITDGHVKFVAEYSTNISPQAQIAYTTMDHLGSPRISTNALGQVIARHDYQPFGEEIARNGYGADSVRKKFTGYEKDGETGLDYAQARYYANNLGRFTSVDLVFVTPERLLDPQRINLFLYSRNNPLKFVDTSGEDIEIA